MIQKEFITKYTEYQSDKELTSEDQELIKMAKEAAAHAYAPYSKFNVGASVLLQNGKIFSGSNQENAAYPSGLCAERVAVFYANSAFPNIPVTKIAICANTENGITKNPVPPCGSCRQVLLETEVRYNKSITTLLIGANKIIEMKGISQLLPLSFKKDNLLE